ncbi:peroxidase-like isoform X2 [Athalia rosae]|nr:peroxidase-like isoform X2 [Athalia rosae]
MIARLDHLGRSYFIALSHVIVGLLSFLVHFVIGTNRGAFYTSLMSSMWIVSDTVASCLATEFFKTRVRVLGVGLTNGFGYLGMTVGMYGMLSKGGTNCISVISIAGILSTAKGVMAGSVATLAILWISLQGTGIMLQPTFMDCAKLPVPLQNYLAAYTSLPAMMHQPDLVLSARAFPDHRVFPAMDRKLINSSLCFGETVVARSERLEDNIAGAGIAFANDTPTQGQYAYWFPTEDAHRKSIEARIVAKASSYLLQNSCPRFGLRNKACARFISTLKMQESSIGARCAREQEVDCNRNSRYRTIDGSCNNLNNPKWGSAMTAYSRVLFPSYADGVQEPRRPEIRGKKLPSPRSVSSSISSNDNPEVESSNTLAVMKWGQFVAHDVSHTPMSRMVTNNKPIFCCRSNGNFLAPRYVHPDCLPISIPENDSIYGKDRIRCMNYVRSMPALRPDCTFGPTEQMNQVTHYLDGSTVYGSSLKASHRLRSFQGGLLRVENKEGYDYLPTADEEPASLCNDEECYSAGDFRVNHDPHLAVMHTIWHREHNQIAAQLANLNPLWNDEILYQEARRIVIAEIQHITYNEWLTVILGKNQTRYGQLFPTNPDGFSHIYNNLDNPSISNEAATAALQFINSLVQGNMRMHDEERRVIGTLHLHEYFGKSKIIESHDVLDSLVRGLTTQNAQKMDANVTPDMTHKLYKTHGKHGMDSISLDIQRGRDHGLPGYNHYRKYCGLPFATHFDDFLDTIPVEMVRKLSMIYNHPNDVDLVVGGTAERPNKDGLLGPTFGCLISEQFARLRRTDRFFYESTAQPHPFTADQLNSIRNVSLARVFCDNGDNISNMQPYVFLNIQPGNELASCDDFEAIPSVDLFAWAEKAKAYR